MSRLRAVDDLIYRAEKVACALMLAVMGVVVFLSVAHRAASSLVPGTPAPNWYLDAGGSLESWPTVGTALVAAITFFASWFGARSRGSARPLVVALSLGVLVPLVIRLLPIVLPNGLVEAQPLALGLLLWLSLLGASIAAKERKHLAIDIGSKIWPAALVPRVAAIGHFVTAGFCLLILGLGLRSVMDAWHVWVASEYAGGLISGVRFLPRWTAALAIPYGMAVLAFRFTLEAIDTWRGEAEVIEDGTLHALGIKLEKAP